MKRLFAYAAIVGLGLASTAAAAKPAPPKPQYSVEDVQRALGASPDENACPASSSSNAAGDCSAPAPRTRGFSLPTTAPARNAQPGSAGSPAVDGGGTQAAVHKPKRPYDLMISFNNNSAALTPQAKANADVFAQALQTPGLANKRFEIAGHTNAVGSREFNLRLSRNRAAAVVAYLGAHGVSSDRLQSSAHGFDNPINAADPRAPENRRVEARRLD